MILRRISFASFVTTCLFAGAASAQQPPAVYPQQPPPGYPQQQQQPPPGYQQQPPPGYPQQQQPPPGYPQQLPPGYQQQPPPGYQQQPPPGYQQQPPPGYQQQPPPGYQQQPPPGYQQQPPPGYPQQPPPGYPQQPPPGYQQPGYPPPMQPPSPPVSSDKRGAGELSVLYGTSIAYGVGTGIWIDGLAKVSDPGIAFIAPLAFGVAAPIGVYLWDENTDIHRGVPASVATGLALGAVEGIAISGTQWQANGGGGPGTWSFGTQSSVTWLLATGGGVGGYAFGEWIHPDPRSLAFIGDGAAWGAISGSMFGAAVGSGDWKDGASVAGLIGFNAGIFATGAIGVAGYVPSWVTQKSMWLGYLVGTAAASVVYLFYLGSDSEPRHGLIANSLGGLAGVGVAWALTANMKDDGQSASWKPPFHIGFAPTAHGGATMTAMGTF